jgi:hypothetical protein
VWRSQPESFGFRHLPRDIGPGEEENWGRSGSTRARPHLSSLGGQDPVSRGAADAELTRDLGWTDAGSAELLHLRGVGSRRWCPAFVLAVSLGLGDADALPDQLPLELGDRAAESTERKTGSVAKRNS